MLCFIYPYVSKFIEVLNAFINSQQLQGRRITEASFAAPSAACVAELVALIQPLTQHDARAEAMMRDLQSDNDQVW